MITLLVQQNNIKLRIIVLELACSLVQVAQYRSISYVAINEKMYYQKTISS